MKFLKLPETIDEIVNYKKEIEKEIKTLETKLEELDKKINIQIDMYGDCLNLYKQLINSYDNARKLIYK